MHAYIDADRPREIGSFSNARYDEVAQFFGLDPIVKEQTSLDLS